MNLNTKPSKIITEITDAEITHLGSWELNANERKPYIEDIKWGSTVFEHAQRYIWFWMLVHIKELSSQPCTRLKRNHETSCLPPDARALLLLPDYLYIHTLNKTKQSHSLPNMCPQWPILKIFPYEYDFLDFSLVKLYFTHCSFPYNTMLEY